MRYALVFLALAFLGCAPDPPLVGYRLSIRASDRASFYIQETGSISYMRSTPRPGPGYPNCREWAGVHGWVVVHADRRTLDVRLVDATYSRNPCGPGDVPVTLADIDRTETWTYSWASGDLEVFDADGVSLGRFR